MVAQFEPIFARLRKILEDHHEEFVVEANEPGRYCLRGRPGPAALRAWKGELRQAPMPVAWVQVGKAYVSYHLMGLYADPTLKAGISKKLKARMQGKTCFNFKTQDEELFKELEKLTSSSIANFKKAGFIADESEYRTDSVPSEIEQA